VAKRNVAMNTAVESDMEMIQYQANQIAKDKELCTINPGTGYANELSKNISETSATLKILNHNYTMTRKIDTITDANVLPISYEFTREGSKTPDYQMYVEVIPNAALTCPSKLSPSV
jgi:putative aminopeptidase FrvX